MNETQTFEPGCYGDGARGIYLSPFIVEFAQAQGFKLYGEDIASVEYEFIDELAEDAINWLNNNTAIPNLFYWGYSEQGDFGLWKSE